MSLAMMYMFIYRIYTSRFEPKTSWKHTMISTTKPLQEIINIQEI
jgi:hypothetical protein